jgi:NAD dependent epimerase/dehydratase family enzyme
VNLASPNPLPHADFMRAMREVGCFLMRSETGLVLNCRRVVPGRLLQAGFEFEFPEWRKAAAALCEVWRRGHEQAR